MNKVPARAGVIWKYTGISNWISFASTQHRYYHEEMPIIAVSLVTTDMELTQLIRNYRTYW